MRGKLPAAKRAGQSKEKKMHCVATLRHPRQQNSSLIADHPQMTQQIGDLSVAARDKTRHAGFWQDSLPG